MSRTRREIMREIQQVHREWSLKHGDTVPYNAADANPPDGVQTDLSLWNATMSAPPAIADELHAKIFALADELATATD